MHIYMYHSARLQHSGLSCVLITVTSRPSHDAAILSLMSDDTAARTCRDAIPTPYVDCCCTGWIMHLLTGFGQPNVRCGPYRCQHTPPVCLCVVDRGPGGRVKQRVYV